MGHLALYLFIALLVVVAGYFVFPKWLCLALGGIALVLGIVAPLAIWSYAKVFVAGDSSSYGMLGTLLMVLFAPGGIALTLVGLLKGR